MRYVKLAAFILGLSLLTISALANRECNIYGRLEQYGDKLDEQFWRDFARLGDKPKERQVDRLLQRFNKKSGEEVIPVSKAPTPQAVTAVQPRVRPRLIKEAERDVERLSKASKSVRDKYAEFVEEISSDPSGSTFYKQPGRWHMEKLVEYGPNARSVRLSREYRVLFDIGKNGEPPTIRSIAIDKIH